MNHPSIHLGTRVLWLAFAVTLVLATDARTQMSKAGGQQATPAMSGADDLQTELHMLTDVQRQAVDPQEGKDYKAFYSADEPAKKIKLGNSFLQKYPKSPLDEPVDVGLMNVYYEQQDWKNLYASADNALALKPDDVDVLTTVGWVIPHIYNPSDPDADQQLDKAETFEKHALAVLATMPKPKGVTDAQFATSKSQKSLQAHSALGLVYFRRDDYDNSAKELEQTTQGVAAADQTDLYVLGIDLQNLKRYGDAADAFGRCAQAPGGLQDRCKQSGDDAKKLAATQSK
jgi:tetratricopeptide (TPR) repeat protein